MFSNLVRRSYSAIKAIKRPRSTTKNYLFPRAPRQHSANISYYRADVSSLVPEFIRSAIAKFTVVSSLYYAYVTPYRKARRFFEGPQTGRDAELQEDTVKYYIHRSTEDVIKIREELVPVDRTTHPYTVIIGDQSGKTELAKECTQQSGVRYAFEDGWLPFNPTIWEALVGTKSGYSNQVIFERQFELLLYAADKYRKSHGKIPVLILEDAALENEQQIPFRQWAIDNSHRIKVVFLVDYFPKELAHEQPKQLTLGEFSTDEARKYLRMKLSIDPPTNYSFPSTQGSNKASEDSDEKEEMARKIKQFERDPSRQWVRKFRSISGQETETVMLTREKVLAAIDRYMEIVGCEVKFLTRVENIDNLDNIISFHLLTRNDRSKVNKK